MDGGNREEQRTVTCHRHSHPTSFCILQRVQDLFGRSLSQKGQKKFDVDTKVFDCHLDDLSHHRSTEQIDFNEHPCQILAHQPPGAQKGFWQFDVLVSDTCEIKVAEDLSDAQTEKK